MDIKSILNQFKILDKNNDLTLSAEELERKSFDNSVWQDIIRPGVEYQEFVIRGLSIESAGDSENLSGFDKMHKKLANQNIRIGCIDGDLAYYENGVRLCIKEINSFDEIPEAATEGVKDARGVDISNLKLTEEQLLDMVIDDYTTMSDEQKAVFEKAKANMSQMGLGIEYVQEQGYKGTAAMALLDQEFCDHEIYTDKVRNSTAIGNNIDSGIGPSWHTASMLTLMHKTSPDTEIEHYCVTDNSQEWDTRNQDAQFAEAIKDIMEKNKSLPDDKKIRTIVMGWGFYPDNPKYDEYIELCKEAVDSGIFISSNNTLELYGMTIDGTDRDATKDVNSPQSYKLGTFYADNWKEIPEDLKDVSLFVPMQHVTIGHRDGHSIQYEGSDGGICWANSTGSLYNDFLCLKPDLKPQEFVDLLMETSDDFIVDGVYCGRLLNARAACEKLKCE